MKRKIVKWTFIVFLLLLLIASYFVLNLEMRSNDESLSIYFSECGVDVDIQYTRGIRSFDTKSLAETNYTIFFVHGAPGGGDQFKSYMADSSLRSVANVISVDRPGYGYSNFGIAEVNIVRQAAALKMVIENTIDTSQKIILVSHSYGGPICAFLSILMKERIHSHLMLNPVLDPYHEKVFWYSPVPLWWPFRYFSSGAMKVAAYEKLSHIDELKKLENFWKDVEVPTVHVQAAKDFLAPKENADFVKEKFNSEHTEITILENSSHLVPFTEKELVVKLIMDQIRREF